MEPLSTTPEPETLLVRVASGDRLAFTDLYDQMAGRVLGVVRAIVRDPDIAEEVAQEVLLEVWRTAERFDPGRGSAAAWIATMARRRAIDRVRSEQAGRERTERAGIGDLDVARDSTVESVEDAADARAARRALDVLTDLQREVIERAFFGDRTYRQVADDLGVPLGTVKTRMRDGLMRLRAELAGER